MGTKIEIPEFIQEQYQEIIKNGVANYLCSRLKRNYVIVGTSKNRFNSLRTIFFSGSKVGVTQSSSRYLPYGYHDHYGSIKFDIDAEIRTPIGQREFSFNILWYTDRNLYCIPVTLSICIKESEYISEKTPPWSKEPLKELTHNRDIDKWIKDNEETELFQFKNEKVGKPKPCDRVISNNIVFLNGYDTVHDAVRKDYWYAEDMISKTGMDPLMYMMAKETEQLYKAGFTELVNSLIVSYTRQDMSRIEMYSRLCKPGTNLKTIFNSKQNPGIKAVYSALKYCGDLQTWDIYRRLVKTGKVSADIVEEIFESNISEKELNLYSEILGEKYNDKPLFTFDTLTNYMDRILTYEAIDRAEGLILLRDYLRCCRQLKIKPKIDSDSLKREHDIAARMCRYKMDPKFENSIEEQCMKLHWADYSSGAFFVRAIRNYKDLMDEAMQQRNCLASYASTIAKGDCNLFVMRRKDCPEKSLITLELSKDCKTIRQKKMAYNRNIRSRAQSDFLDEWVKHLRAEKDGEYVKMLEEYKLAYPEDAKDSVTLYRNVCKAMDHYYRYGDIPVAIYETHAVLSEES